MKVCSFCALSVSVLCDDVKMPRMFVTQKVVVFMSTSVFVMVCLCLMCSASIFAGCSGAVVFDGCVLFAQQPPNMNLGIGGDKNLSCVFQRANDPLETTDLPNNALVW